MTATPTAVTGPVRVLHTPNHRGFKGTEFLVDAVGYNKVRGLPFRSSELAEARRRPSQGVVTPRA